MPGILKMFTFSTILMAVSMLAGDVEAVSAIRTSATPSRGAATGARMPTMPTIPINGADLNTGNNNSNNNGGTTRPDNPDTPDNPDVPDVPDVPQPDCPDGGVKNSAYTVAMCMDDVYRCIISGALPNGINDMFNEDLRNAIVNGMGVCSVQVDKCVEQVRRNCSNVYRSTEDVWIDFNARKVQPDYYNFVLRKTGLTPNQAENTCLLLDRNTYGGSFNAVSNMGNVTAEYNQKVGAYNGQRNDSLVKNSPLGVTPNQVLMVCVGIMHVGTQQQRHVWFVSQHITRTNIFLIAGCLVRSVTIDRQKYGRPQVTHLVVTRICLVSR